MKLCINGLFYKDSEVGRYHKSLVKGLTKEGIKIYACVLKESKKDSFKKGFRE